MAQINYDKLNQNIAEWYNDGEFTSNAVKKQVKQGLASLFDAMDKNHNKNLSDDNLDKNYLLRKLGLESTNITRDEFLSDAVIEKIITTMGENEEKLDANFVNKTKPNPKKSGNSDKTSNELNLNDAYADGYNTAIDLVGHTNKIEKENVKNRLKKINKNTVKHFIDGYNKNKGIWGHGLFEQLGSEGSHLDDLNTGKYKCKVVVPVMKAALDAVPSNQRNNSEYKQAYAIYKKYKEKGDDADFSTDQYGTWMGWVRCFGDNPLAEFDKAILKLLDLT